MCGIVGIFSKKDVKLDLYDALTILQHRGQDAAGIMTCHNGRFNQRKSIGLVKDVFNTRHMTQLKGNMGIGHVRYPTAGSSSPALAQPFYVNSPYGICMAHNGNLTNTEELMTLLFNSDLRHINTDSDSEALLNVFAHELLSQGKIQPSPDDIFDSVGKVHKRCKGAYAVVGMIANYGMIAFRDPFGIRPLIYGRRETDSGTEYIVASETVAMDVLGYEVVRDLKPGEALYIDQNGKLHSKQCTSNSKLNPCIFEHVYFSRPDSVIDGVSVHEARLRMGSSLARRIMRIEPNHQIDAVIPVPDSGCIAALELARELGVPYREGFVKNRYIGRTFIMPGQSVRKDSVRKKLNTIESEFTGKTVLIVDDSIVRGNTSKRIVEMARKAGATKVFFASAAPPIIHPNVYGIDMPAKNEYVAHNRSNSEICEAIGADWMIYQDLGDLVEACLGAGDNNIATFDCSCFDGIYVTGGVTDEYLNRIEKSRNDNAKKSVSV